MWHSLGNNDKCCSLCSVCMDCGLSLNRLIQFVTANDFQDLHWNTYVVESRRFARYDGRTLSKLEYFKSYNLDNVEHSLAKVLL